MVADTIGSGLGTFLPSVPDDDVVLECAMAKAHFERFAEAAEEFLAADVHIPAVQQQVEAVELVPLPNACAPGVVADCDAASDDAGVFADRFDLVVPGDVRSDDDAYAALEVFLQLLGGMRVAVEDLGPKCIAYDAAIRAKCCFFDAIEAKRRKAKKRGGQSRLRGLRGP